MSTTLFRRALLTTGTAAVIVAGSAGVASASGSITNSCAVNAPVVVTTVKADGAYIDWLACGKSAAGVTFATVDAHPFYVIKPGQAPKCFQAGERFYPASTGAVLQPTVRCTSTPAPAPGPSPV